MRAVLFFIFAWTWLLRFSLTGAEDCAAELPTWPAGAFAQLCALGGTAAASPACSVYRLCANASVMPSLGASACKESYLWTSLCMDMPSLLQCTSMATLFNSTAPAGSYMGCLHNMSMSLYSTSAVTGAVTAMCTEMPMTGCDKCTTQSCADPLATLSELCLSMDMSQCDPWATWCQEVGPSNAAVLCQQPAQRGTSTSQYACILNPAQDACAQFVYPEANATADAVALCTSMPDMSGCTLRTACQAGEVTGQYCTAMSLLAALCTEMPSMSGCHNYNAMCNATAGSKVQQCISNPAMPSIPSSTAARSAVLSACSDHSMEACSSCTSSASCPHPLTSLVAVCHAMPDMQQCQIFQTWCGAAGSAAAYFCSDSGSSYLPAMTMYFHRRVEDIVLWRDWIPRTKGQYAATIIAIMAFGVISVGLKTWKAALGVAWSQQRARAGAAAAGGSADSSYSTAVAGQQACGALHGGCCWWLPSRRQLLENSIKAVILGVSLTLDYWNMLVAMTFNAGLFCAVVLGYVLGTFLFSHALEAYTERVMAVTAKATAPSAVPLRKSAGADASSGSTTPTAGATSLAGGDSAGDLEAGQAGPCTAVRDTSRPPSASGVIRGGGGAPGGAPVAAAAVSVAVTSTDCECHDGMSG